MKNKKERIQEVERQLSQKKVEIKHQNLEIRRLKQELKKLKTEIKIPELIDGGVYHILGGPEEYDHYAYMGATIANKRYFTLLKGGLVFRSFDNEEDFKNYVRDVWEKYDVKITLKARDFESFGWSYFKQR